MYGERLRKHRLVYQVKHYAWINTRFSWLYSFERSWRKEHYSCDIGICNICRTPYFWSLHEGGAYPRLCVRCVREIRRLEMAHTFYGDEEIPF